MRPYRPVSRAARGDWFVRWLARESCGLDLVIWLTMATTIAVCWGISMAVVFNLLDPAAFKFRPELVLTVASSQQMGDLCVRAAMEELKFRALLGYAVRVIGYTETLKLGVVLSFVFGAEHTLNSGLTFTFALMVQGVLGSLYTLVFLKAGGAHGRIARGLCCSTFVHALYNTVVTAIAAGQ